MSISDMKRNDQRKRKREREKEDERLPNEEKKEMERTRLEVNSFIRITC